MIGEPRRLKARTKEELDAEMDRYMMKDEKTAEAKLNDDLDAYFKNAETDGAAAAAGAENDDAATDK